MTGSRDEYGHLIVLAIARWLALPLLIISLILLVGGCESKQPRQASVHVIPRDSSRDTTNQLAKSDTVPSVRDILSVPASPFTLAELDALFADSSFSIGLHD